MLHLPILQVFAEVRCLRDDNQRLAQELAALRSTSGSSADSSSSSSADYRVLAAKARKLEKHNARLKQLLLDVRDNCVQVKKFLYRTFCRTGPSYMPFCMNERSQELIQMCIKSQCDCVCALSSVLSCIAIRCDIAAAF
jgi:hypothetical protein